MPKIRTISDVPDNADRVAIDNGDAFEVVYDRYAELALIQVTNKIWQQPEQYLAVISTEPERYINELIRALEDLKAQLRKPRDEQDR